MPTSFVIQFTCKTDAADSTHRIRNFAEDLHRAMDRDGLGRVENGDAAVHFVTIQLESKRQRGAAEVLARRLLERHHLSQDSAIEG